MVRCTTWALAMVAMVGLARTACGDPVSASGDPISCFGIPRNDPAVCSGHGLCIGVDTCVCEAGWSGSDCSLPTCFGVNGNDPAVCSGRGVCVDVDTCACESGWSGADCSILTCFGVNENDPAVCSGRGVCVDVDTCACESGWSGADCSVPDGVSVPAITSLGGLALAVALVLVSAGAHVSHGSRRTTV